MTVHRARWTLGTQNGRLRLGEIRAIFNLAVSSRGFQAHTFPALCTFETGTTAASQHFHSFKRLHIPRLGFYSEIKNTQHLADEQVLVHFWS